MHARLHVLQSYAYIHTYIHTFRNSQMNTTSNVNYINTRSSHRVPCENLIHLVTSFQVPRDNFNYIK